jgi:hypothetical protein
MRGLYFRCHHSIYDKESDIRLDQLNLCAPDGKVCWMKPPFLADEIRIPCQANRGGVLRVASMPDGVSGRSFADHVVSNWSHCIVEPSLAPSVASLVLVLVASI